MKKWLKITFVVIGGFILLFIMDIICIFTINRPLLALKKDNGTIYKGVFYDTYNCPEFSVPQIKVKGTKFHCIDSSVNKDKVSSVKATEVNNVKMDISDISHTGATITIKDTNKIPYTYGEFYKIEKEIDGQWHDVKPIITDYGFNDKGYIVDENHEVKFIIDWEWLYGKLPLGSYRILKKVNDQYISVEFGIATTF